jgi:hypothetical protein
MYRFCKQFTKAMQKYNIYRPSCLLPYFALNLNEKKRKMRQINVLFMLLLPQKRKGGRAMPTFCANARASIPIASPAIVAPIIITICASANAIMADAHLETLTLHSRLTAVIHVRPITII